MICVNNSCFTQPSKSSYVVVLASIGLINMMCADLFAYVRFMSAGAQHWSKQQQHHQCPADDDWKKRGNDLVSVDVDINYCWWGWYWFESMWMEFVLPNPPSKATWSFCRQAIRSDCTRRQPGVQVQRIYRDYLLLADGKLNRPSGRTANHMLQ
jgi:hypothetical protein